MSQDALGKRSGLGGAAIEAIESRNADPAWSEVCGIINALEVSLTRLASEIQHRIPAGATDAAGPDWWSAAFAAPADISSKRPLNLARPRPEDQKALGRAIRVLRERQNLTRQGVAKGAEIDERTLEKIEDGKGETPWSVVRRIADAIGVSTDEISQVDEKAMRKEKGDEADDHS